jgi:hypothetical protein
MTTKERLDRHDRQIAGITKLLQTGMRMLVKTQEEVRGLAGEVRGLTVEVKGLAVEVRGWPPCKSGQKLACKRSSIA